MRTSLDRIFSSVPLSVTASPQIHVAQKALSQDTSYVDLDAIVIVGASMDYRRRSGTWKFGTIVHNGKGKIDAGNSRAAAASQIVAEGYKGLFLVTGGSQTGPDGRKVSQAKELAHVMTSRRRIAQSTVVPVGRENSTNTHGNAADAAAFLEAHREMLVHKKIGILANEWHMLRAFLIFNQHPFFQQEGIQLVPIDANKVLLRRSKIYHLWNTYVRMHPAMKTKVKLEAQGIQDLLAGTYKPRH